MVFVVCCIYGCFLTASSIAAPTMIIAIMTPTIAGTKYKSTADCTGAAVGAAVGVAGSIAKYAVSEEP